MNLRKGCAARSVSTVPQLGPGCGHRIRTFRSTPPALDKADRELLEKCYLAAASSQILKILETVRNQGLEALFVKMEHMNNKQPNKLDG